MKLLSQKINIIILFLSILMLGCTMADDMMMKSFVKRFNKKCPIITESISIDGAELISKDTIEIYISFVYDLNNSEIHLQKQVLPHSMELPLLEMVRNKQYKLMRNRNVNFLFSFSTNTGIHIVDVPITPEQYNQPIQDSTAVQLENMGTMGILHYTANSIKTQLPIESPDTGIKTIDCLIEDSTLISVNIIPNRFKEEVLDKMDITSFINLFYMEISQKEAVKNTISNGINLKHKYIFENGDTLPSLILNKKNIDTDFSKLVDTKTRTQYSINLNLHNIKREIENKEKEKEEIYYTDCYFKNNTLTIVLQVSENAIENDSFDTDLIYDNILEESLNDELFTLFLLKKGISLEYIYKDEDDETLDTLLVTEKDVSKYKKQRYDNYEILKY